MEILNFCTFWLTKFVLLSTGADAVPTRIESPITNELPRHTALNSDWYLCPHSSHHTSILLICRSGDACVHGKETNWPCSSSDASVHAKEINYVAHSMFEYKELQCSMLNPNAADMSTQKWLTRHNVGDLSIFIGMNYPIVGVGPEIHAENEIVPMPRNGFIYICCGDRYMHGKPAPQDPDVCRMGLDGEVTIGFQLKENGWGVPDNILWVVSTLKNAKCWNTQSVPSKQQV